MKKQQPYKEIIYLREEREEYVRLCNGKSTKYKYFTDWEAHIRERLLLIKDPQDLYNFKRYCMNVDRKARIAPEMFMSYFLLLIPLYIDAFFEGFPALIKMIVAISSIIFVIAQNIKMKQECYISHDILEIIEKIEKEQSNQAN